MMLSRGYLKIVVDFLSRQNRLQLLNVSFGQSQSVQFAEFCVWRHPGEFRLESAESTGQDPHPGTFPGIGCVSLDRLSVFWENSRITVTFVLSMNHFPLNLPEESSSYMSLNVSDTDRFRRGIFYDFWFLVVTPTIGKFRLGRHETRELEDERIFFAWEFSDDPIGWSEKSLIFLRPFSTLIAASASSPPPPSFRRHLASFLIVPLIEGNKLVTRTFPFAVSRVSST